MVSTISLQSEKSSPTGSRYAVFSLGKKIYHYTHLYFGFIYDIARNLFLRTDGKTFCFLFNAKAKLSGFDVRFYYDSSQKKYFVQSEFHRLYFYHTKQAYLSYCGGLKQRVSTLGADYFLPQIDFKAGDLVVDCGANVGDLNLYFTENRIPVEYLAVEPSPLEYECLVANVAPAKTLNLGFWFEEGTLDFFVSSQGADSSIIRPPTYDSVIKIPTKRLDEVIFRPIKLLKLEAEGAEPEVLTGCERILDQIEYISADLGYERGIKQTSTLVPVVNFLLERNFELLAVSRFRLVALFRNKKYGKSARENS